MVTREPHKLNTVVRIYLPLPLDKCLKCVIIKIKKKGGFMLADEMVGDFFFVLGVGVAFTLFLVFLYFVVSYFVVKFLRYLDDRRNSDKDS